METYLSITAIIISIISLIMPFFYYAKPIDYNLTGLTRKMIECVIGSEMISFTVICLCSYFIRKSEIKLDIGNTLSIITLCVSFFVLVLSIIGLCRSDSWQKTKCAKKIVCIAIILFVNMIFFTINMGLLEIVSMEDISFANQVRILLVVVFITIIMAASVYCLVRNNSRYNGSKVIIHFCDNTTEALCVDYNSIHERENYVVVERDNGCEKINRSIIKKIEYEYLNIKK